MTENPTAGCVSRPALRSRLILRARLRAVAAALGIVASLAACGNDHSLVAPQFVELDRAIALWSTHGTGPYTMEQRRDCECVQAGRRYRLGVENGHVVSAVDVATGEILPAEQRPYFLSVEQLFAQIRTLQATPGAEVRVTYDNGTGYPVTAYLDPSSATDNEILYSNSAVQTRLD